MHPAPKPSLSVAISGPGVNEEGHCGSVPGLEGRRLLQQSLPGPETLQSLCLLGLPAGPEAFLPLPPQLPLPLLQGPHRRLLSEEGRWGLDVVDVLFDGIRNSF